MKTQSLILTYYEYSSVLLKTAPGHFSYDTGSSFNLLTKKETDRNRP